MNVICIGHKYSLNSMVKKIMFIHFQVIANMGDVHLPASFNLISGKSQLSKVEHSLHPNNGEVEAGGSIF